MSFSFSSDRLTKKEAAKEAYEYVRSVLHEDDEQDIMRAAVLMDLFDCGACVMNVAQVYLKGIIFPKSEREFGINDVLTALELDEIAERVVYTERRKPPMTDAGAFDEIPFREFGNATQARLIDVRDEDAFSAGHTETAENIPLQTILINPHILGNDVYEPFVFICEKGLKSYKAATVAKKAGYRDVSYAKM